MKEKEKGKEGFGKGKLKGKETGCFICGSQRSFDHFDKRGSFTLQMCGVQSLLQIAWKETLRTPISEIATSMEKICCVCNLVH